MKRTGPTAGGVLLLLVLAGHSSAQSLPVGDPYEAYLRVLQLTGAWEGPSLTVRPIPIDIEDIEESAHPWSHRFGAGVPGAELRWSVDRARVGTSINSRHPRGWNDGALWQGKGLNTTLEHTARLAWRGLSITLNPLLIYNQNGAFDLAPEPWPELPPVAYPWHRLDLPQRFGSESFWTLDPGQSQIALDWGAARISAGNENLWWGPGIRSAIVMSNNAPGFLHASLSTNRPVSIGIGEIEGQWIWGGLGQSDFYDPALESRRFMTGLVLTWQPSFLDGLSLGGTRVFQELVPPGGIDAGEYLLVFQGLLKEGLATDDNPAGNDERDQLLSIFARWVMPGSGFEAYLEWARNDHSWSLQDFLLEPEHSQAYTVGFQKVTSASADRTVVFRGEVTRLEAPPTFQVRPRGVYYTHSAVRQGYTQKGQVLGSWLGPGGNGQFLGLDLFSTWGSAGVFFQRQVHDNDAYWRWAADNGSPFDRHDVSFDFGVNGRYFLGDLEVGGGLVYTRELNRYFFGPKVNNWNVHLTGAWRAGFR